MPQPAWPEPGVLAEAGVVLSGAALGSTGLAGASIHPEQAVLYTADAVDQPVRDQ